MKKIIHTDEAPAAIGPYSQAVVYGNTVYCSGQIALDPETMNFSGNDVESQTRQVMENLKAVLLEAGSDLDKVIKCSIF
ncbi:MAG: Rid family hydrolase, partial [Balneolaceae bacterium]